MKKILLIFASLIFAISMLGFSTNLKAEKYLIDQVYKYGEDRYQLKKIINPEEFKKILVKSEHNYVIYPALSETKVYITKDFLEKAVPAKIESEYVLAGDTGLGGSIQQVLKFKSSYEEGLGTYYVKNDDEWSVFAKNIQNPIYDLKNYSLYIFTKQSLPKVLNYTSKYDVDILTKKSIEEIKNDITFETQHEGEIVITKDTYSSNYNVHGQYEIKFKIVDKITRLESEEKIIIMNAVDRNKVFIYGPESIKVEVKTTIDLDFLKQYYTAKKGNQDFTERLIVETDLTDISNTLGNKTIVLKVTDTINTFSKTITLIVEDTTTPTIIGPDEISLLTNKDNSVSEILKKYTFSDNYNSRDELKITTIPETINKNVFHLTIICKDTSNNENRKIVTLRFIDGVAPKLEGPTTIYKGQRDYITSNYIKSLMTATDETDGNLNNFIKIELDELTGFSNVSGTYNIVFSVKDSANNESKKTVKVIVNKYIENYIILDNTIMISSTHQLKKENIVQAIEIMKDTQIAVEGTNVSFDNKLEEYIENYQKIGYKNEDLELTYNKLDGTSAVVKYNIEVIRNTLFGKAKENIFKTVAYYILGISAMGFLIFVAVKVSKRRRGKRR